jgi:hypothetical protein
LATVYITEFSGLARTQLGGDFGTSPIAPKVAGQTVAIGGASVASTAFNASTTLIRVHTDAICSIEVGGVAPVATATSARLAAGQTEYYGVTPGDKLAVITNT